MAARTPGALHVLTRPGMLLLHAVAISGIVAAVLLGRWQVGAWQMHREDRAAEIADDAPVPLASVNWTSTLIMSTVAVILVVAGTSGYQRRDLQG